MGKAESLFEQARGLFLREVPSIAFKYVQKPSGKTLQNYFKRHIDRCRSAVKGTAAASEIRAAWRNRNTV